MHVLDVVARVHACKSEPLDCIPKPQRQADIFHTYTTQQSHNTDNTTCTAQFEQHDLAVLQKSTTKTFVEFPKLIGSTFFLLLFVFFSNRSSHAIPRTQIQK